MLPNLTAPAFAAAIRKLAACNEARTWAKGLDYATAWATCHRGDWLLWLLNAAAPLDDKTNELLVCRFSREVVHLNPDPRALACIEVREAWARGEATDVDRAAAGAAAGDAAGAAAWAPAGAAAWDAARAAARDAVRDAARVAAGDAARDAAWAVAGAAARDAAGVAAWAAAWAAAKDAAGARQADIIRELVAMPQLLISQS